LDNLLDEDTNFGFDLVVIGIVYHFPVILFFVENCEYSENGHNFMAIPMNVLLEVYKTVFNSGFQRLGQLFVKFFEEVKPLGLDMLLAGKEELLVGGDELTPDYLEVVFESFLLELEVRLLLVHELLKFVKLALLDVGQDGRGNYLELVSNFGLTDLEVVDLLKDVSAVASTLVHETIP
jgi:hypothetical protein